MAYTDTINSVLNTVAALAGTGTDATAAVQACVDNDVRVPAGTYRILGQLVVGGGKSLEGSGPDRTLFDDRGSDHSDGTISLTAGWGTRIAGFALTKNGSPKTGVGIRAGTTPGGSTSGAAVWERVWVVGYSIGFYGGDSATDGACSEHLYLNCHFEENTIGVKLAAQDTLNHAFLMLGLNRTTTGVQSDGAAAITILCGSASATADEPITTLFDMGHAHGFAVRDFRSELVTKFFAHGTTTASQNILIDHCWISENPSVDPVDIDVQWGSNATIRDNFMNGYVRYSGVVGDPSAGYGRVDMSRNATTHTKILETVDGRNCRLDLRFNTLLDSSNQTAKAIRRVQAKAGQETSVFDT